MKRQPPVHPFSLVLLALLATLVLGTLYGVFGIGKDALIFAFSALVVFAMPVVVVFGVTGIVVGIRRLMRSPDRRL
jgi:hypothetical protein